MGHKPSHQTGETHAPSHPDTARHPRRARRHDRRRAGARRCRAGPAAHSSSSKCFIARIAKHRVRECLVQGPARAARTGRAAWIHGGNRENRENWSHRKNWSHRQNRSNGTCGPRGATGCTGPAGTRAQRAPSRWSTPESIAEPGKGLSANSQLHRRPEIKDRRLLSRADRLRSTPRKSPFVVTRGRATARANCGRSSWSMRSAPVAAPATEFEVVTYDARSSRASTSSYVGFASACAVKGPIMQ